MTQEKILRLAFRQHAFSKMAEAALSECAESYGVYSIAQTVYQEFTEGEIEI